MYRASSLNIRMKRQEGILGISRDSKCTSEVVGSKVVAYLMLYRRCNFAFQRFLRFYITK